MLQAQTVFLTGVVRAHGHTCTAARVRDQEAASQRLLRVGLGNTPVCANSTRVAGLGRSLQTKGGSSSRNTLKGQHLSHWRVRPPLTSFHPATPPPTSGDTRAGVEQSAWRTAGPLAILPYSHGPQPPACLGLTRSARGWPGSIPRALDSVRGTGQKFGFLESSRRLQLMRKLLGRRRQWKPLP